MPAVSPMPKRSTVIVAAAAVIVLVSGVIITRVTAGGGPAKRVAVERAAPSAADCPRVAGGQTGPTLKRAGLDVGFASVDSLGQAIFDNGRALKHQWL